MESTRRIWSSHALTKQDGNLMKIPSNFTPRAETVLTLARKAREQYGGPQISPEHIAEGLVELGQGVHFNAWQTLKFPIEEFRKANIEAIKESAKRPLPLRRGKGDLSPEAETLLKATSKIANGLNHHYVGTETILLALMRTNTRASQLLKRMGLTYREVEHAVLKELDPDFEGQKKTGDKADIVRPEPGNQPTKILKCDEIGFQILIDPGDAATDVIVEVLDAISDLNRAVGGKGMIFRDCPDEANVYSGIGV